MDSLMWDLFACMALPLLLSMVLMDRKARTVIGSMVSGMFMCMFVASVNGLIRSALPLSLFEITTNYTPVTEEIVKAIPVFLFAFAVSDRREDLIGVSLAVGIGFAILENAYLLASQRGSWGPFTAVSRVFGASLMHGLCTSVVGIGMSFIYKRRKFFYTGTFALLIFAEIYHGIFNALVQSAAPWIGYALPVVTFVPIVIAVRKSRAKGPQGTALS